MEVTCRPPLISLIAIVVNPWVAAAGTQIVRLISLLIYHHKLHRIIFQRLFISDQVVFQGSIIALR